MGASGLQIRRSALRCRLIASVLFIFVGLGYLFSASLKSTKVVKLTESPSSLICTTSQPEPVHRQPALEGPPKGHFRDNLRNDTFYITAWSSSGLTNAVMSIANMIYLGKLSDRIPILPPFAPSAHISRSAGIIPFGDIFDLNVLREVLGMELLEWKDVKHLPESNSEDPYSADEIDELGCWTTVKESSRDPTTSDNVVHHIGLDVSYTRVPSNARLPTDTPASEEPHVILPVLAALVYPRSPLVNPESTTLLKASPNGHSRSPDEQLSCFDFLYYASSGVVSFEWERTWSPVWNTVGKYLRFTAAVEEVASGFMARAFKIRSSSEKIQPFIAVHIRRGDFLAHCKPDEVEDLGEECFPSLEVYAKRVEDVKEQLRLTRNIYVSNVIVMSDEMSAVFWDDVRSLGWFFVNHVEERTVERYGEWYPPLVDTVIHSHAIGFVGTQSSTFSLLGERRVQDWNGGFVREVSIWSD